MHGLLYWSYMTRRARHLLRPPFAGVVELLTTLVWLLLLAMQEERDGQLVLLAAHTSIREAPKNATQVIDGGIPIRLVGTWLSKAQARKQVVILDTTGTESSAQALMAAATAEKALRGGRAGRGS
ncbi:MAG: hypothetical protein GY946_19255 [bacterium]|nr:hypothetical protein [bacterium]